MLISLLVLLLFSNAVTTRRDKSILFSRVVIVSLLFAGYYLNLIKQIFFFKNDYIVNPQIGEIKVTMYHSKRSSLNINRSKDIKEYITYTAKPENVSISGSLSVAISALTLLLILFIYMPEEWFSNRRIRPCI